MNKFNRDKLRYKLEQRNRELKEASETAIALLQNEEHVQDNAYTKKVAVCEAFVKKMEAKKDIESNVEKLIFINCYMALGKHYVNFYKSSPLLHYSKAQNYFLKAYNRSVAALLSNDMNVLLLDNASAFCKISIYLAYYYDDKKNAPFHYKKICDIAPSAFEYSIKWKKTAHTFELAAILAIAYQSLGNFDKAIIYFDHMAAMDNEQQDYSNIMRLEFMLAMVCTSKLLNRQRQYLKAVGYCKIILKLSELNLEHGANYKAVDIVNNRIKFECLLNLAIANIGLADLCACKAAYMAALVTHIFIYQHNLASEVYKKNYPLMAMAEKLEKVIKYINNIIIYLNIKDAKLTILNSEQVFKEFLYDHIPNLTQDPIEQLNFEELQHLADEISDYMTLIKAWPASKKFKIELIQKAAAVNRLIQNVSKVSHYEAMLVELDKAEVKAEEDIIKFISATKVEPVVAGRVIAKEKAKKPAKPLITKPNVRQSKMLNKEEIQQNYHQTILLTAYRYYKEMKFSKAIKLYDKLRHQKNLNSDLITMQCLCGIGENYSAWAADLEQQQVETKTIQTYKENALQAYLMAVQLLPKNINDHQEPDDIEMQRLAEFIYPLVNALQAADVREVKEEINIIAENYNESQENQQLSLQTEETKLSANIITKPLITNVANYLSSSLEKILQQPVKEQRPTVTICMSLAISPAAKEIESTLKEAGFNTYLVGGAVRDQILNVQPKDYDIVTNAHPEEITALFPGRSEIVGSRFTLVLVKINKEIFEVATLRQGSPLQNANSDGAKSALNYPYGTSLHEDVQNRDFTINGLYYNDNTIIDLVGGYEDINSRLIRTIGNAKNRFSNDPIIMLRCLRLAAKLNFDLYEDIRANLSIQMPLLAKVNLDRLYSEVQHTFLQGFGAKVFPLAYQYGVFQVLFLEIGEILAKDEHWRRCMQTIMSEIDHYYSQNKKTSPAIFFAVMLWPFLQASIRKQGVKNSIQAVIANQHKTLRIPDIIVNNIKAIWLIHLSNYHALKSDAGIQIKNEDFLRANIFANLLKKGECLEDVNIAAGIKFV